jgi:hypothetical protein
LSPALHHDGTDIARISGSALLSLLPDSFSGKRWNIRLNCDRTSLFSGKWVCGDPGSFDAFRPRSIHALRYSAGTVSKAL